MNIACDTVLTWTPSSHATSYELQMAEVADFSVTTLDTAGIDTVVCAVFGLRGQTRYYWRVRAANAVGTGAWSSTVYFTTGTTTGIISGKADVEAGIPRTFSATAASHTLRYALPRPCQVKVQFADLKGRSAATLVNSVQPAGYYSLSFGRISLSPGAYLMVFEAGGFVKRQLVIKR